MAEAYVATMERLVDWYRGESRRMTEALAMLTKYVPKNEKRQSEGTVAIPLRELVAARDLGRSRPEMEIEDADASEVIGGRQKP